MKQQELNKRRFIGDLCNHEHEYKASGGSLRYKGCRACCVCNALSVEKNKKRHEAYRKANKPKMDKYQANYRKNFRSKKKKVKL